MSGIVIHLRPTAAALDGLPAPGAAAGEPRAFDAAGALEVAPYEPPPAAPPPADVAFLRDIMCVRRSEFRAGTACFWDCHAFEGPAACQITHFSKGTWYGTGHYCSPACALAALEEDGKLSTHEKWERISLTKTFFKRDIRPAPPRTQLALFGGPLTIQQFRDLLLPNHVILEAVPPVILKFPLTFIHSAAMSPPADGTELRVKRSKPVTWTS